MKDKLSIAEDPPQADPLGLSPAEWKSWALDHGAAPFAGGQIYQWIHQKRVRDPHAFSNIPLDLRTLLASDFNWELPAIDSHLISKDGSEKLLLLTKDKLLFEMVLMPYANRTTLCISSQIGCRMGCTFCQTGKMGLMRNLAAGEIIGQLHLANDLLAAKGSKPVSNVVFMGMGEPLDNYEELIKACAIMVDPKGFGLSKAKVTISTSGLVPEIRRLAADLPLRLAISLHNADDEKRSSMMPVNRRYSLAALKEALLEYPSPSGHGITFEYVMIEGVNDEVEDAKKLVRYLSGMKAKVNLIPINHFPGMELKASTAERLRRFQHYLSSRSIPAPVRYSRGQDISGGCGQLAAKRKEELEVDPRLLSRLRRRERSKHLPVLQS